MARQSAALLASPAYVKSKRPASIMIEIGRLGAHGTPAPPEVGGPPAYEVAEAKRSAAAQATRSLITAPFDQPSTWMRAGSTHQFALTSATTPRMKSTSGLIGEYGSHAPV